MESSDDTCGNLLVVIQQLYQDEMIDEEKRNQLKGKQPTP